MLKVELYNNKGKKLESVNLPKEYEVAENLNLLSQALHVYHARIHTGTSKVKTRSEINRTKKKVYKQKGTGGARHGARSAPIYVGGGIAHGPKVEKRDRVLPKNVRRKALQVAISMKAKMGQIILVNGITSFAKTTEAQKMLNLIKKDRNLKKSPKITIIYKENTGKALNNLENVNTVSVKDVNAYNLLAGGLILMDQAIVGVETKEKKVTKKTKK